MVRIRLNLAATVRSVLRSRWNHFTSHESTTLAHWISIVKTLNSTARPRLYAACRSYQRQDPCVDPHLGFAEEACRCAGPALVYEPRLRKEVCPPVASVCEELYTPHSYSMLNDGASDDIAMARSWSFRVYNVAWASLGQKGNRHATITNCTGCDFFALFSLLDHQETSRP